MSTVATTDVDDWYRVENALFCWAWVQSFLDAFYAPICFLYQPYISHYFFNNFFLEVE